MGSDHSDSDDDKYRRQKDKKVRRKSRSRSSSRDRSRHVRKSKHSRRHSRSDSESSEKVSRKRHRSRSRSSEYKSKNRDKRRSRSRSRSRSDHESKSKSSRYRRSRSSSRRSSRSRESSHKSRESHQSRSSKSSKEPNRHHALAEKKVQKALQAAVTADDILRAQGVLDDGGVVGGSGITTKKGGQKSQLTFEEQQKRASLIQDIDSGEFFQQTFKSNRSEIPLPAGSSVDASHSGAMFSSSSVVPQPHAMSSSSLSYHSHGDSIMHPNLYIGGEEKMETWKKKVAQLRRTKRASGIKVY